MKYGNFILILFMLITIIAKNRISSIAKDSDYSGTLIATVITKEKILLFSDGRIIYGKDNTITSDSFSKLHKLTDKVGMLTAGRYIHKLTPEIVKVCEDTKTIYVEDVVVKTKLMAEKIWQEYSLEHSNNQTNNMRDIRFFLFVVGYDRNSKPRLYYLDNMTPHPFEIQERVLFNAKQNIEIASMSTGSGETEDPGNIIAGYVNYEINMNRKIDLLGAILVSFNKTKEVLSERNHHIGGRTFVAIIDPNNGYENVNIK